MHLKKIKRIQSIDQLRGIAVLIMILSHSITFFAGTQISYLHNSKLILNTFAFTTFLFVSGMSSYISIKNRPLTKTKLLYRTSLIYLGYLIISITTVLPKLFKVDFIETIQLLINILFLNYLPKFGEFLVAFIIFGVISFTFRRQLLYISKSLSRVVITSSVSFLLALFLYSIEVTYLPVIYKAYLFGHNSLATFPPLFYLPVFLSGCYLASSITLNKIKNLPANLIQLAYKALTLLLLVIGVTAVYGNFELSLLNQRFPPSLIFIILTSTTPIFVYWLLEKVPFKAKVLEFFSKNSLNMLISHIVVLYLYDYSIEFQSRSLLFWVISTVALFLVSSGLVILAKNIKKGTLLTGS